MCFGFEKTTSTLLISKQTTYFGRTMQIRRTMKKPSESDSTVMKSPRAKQKINHGNGNPINLQS